MNDMNDMNDMNKRNSKILDHEYDGIREYDNPLPQWWTWLMWGTVLFSVPYFVFYTFGTGETLEQSYDSETAAFFTVLARRLGDIQPDEQTLVRLSKDDTFMSIGRVLFRANCSVCHGPDGGGGTGPNLTDDSFINVKQVTDLYRVIHDGVINKGMPAWNRNFSQPQMVVLSAYVASLRGTTPSAPKAPEGQVIAPWPAPVPVEKPAAGQPAARHESGPTSPPDGAVSADRTANG
ncbi:MAG: c-type cytochrome [Phycisphaeraceae bacterium]|nr:c-type cytochrome [Phycisphaeraceae bacterium]